MSPTLAQPKTPVCERLYVVEQAVMSVILQLVHMFQPLEMGNIVVELAILATYQWVPLISHHALRATHQKRNEG